jgi:DNA-binding transcriptional ArsR family regulator
MAPANTQSKEPGAGDGARLERVIVLQLLRDEHEQPWSREELAAELGVPPPSVDAAARRLAGAGVVCVGPDGLTASPAARRLDELELIAV